MTKPTFAARCLLAQQCLPDAPYRAMLTKLHDEMLAALERQPPAAPSVATPLVQEPVQPANKCAFQIELKASMTGGSPYPAWVNTSEMERLASQLKKVGDRITLYTTPPGVCQSEDCLTAAQRPVAEPHKWVDLTDDDIQEIHNKTNAGYALIWLVADMLREKKGGAA